MPARVAVPSLLSTKLTPLGKDPLSIGQIPPSPDVVGLYFNDSTGEGDNGEADYRGPWNEEPVLTMVNSPALNNMAVGRQGTPAGS